MEIDQLVKRLDWFESERRKEKGDIQALEERITILEGGLKSVLDQVKDVSGEITRLAAVLNRLDQFESDLAKHRLEVNRSIDDIEKDRAEREREIDEVHRVQLDGVNNHIVELRKGLDSIARLEGSIQSQMEEDYRLSRLIDELDQKIKDARRSEEDHIRNLRLLEEGARRDAKRLTDLQGEIVAFRKRLDEQRGRLDLVGDSLRKLETRLSEVATLQAERQETQVAFMEKQSLKEVERNRIWREWETRFEVVEQQTSALDSQLQGLEEARRSVKRAQETLDDITERIERRINEITEMQRLAEERFRQEWVTFKADDQKRWTNFTLSQEEQTREANRQLELFTDQIQELRDELKESGELIRQLDEQTEKRLQSLLAITRDWVAEYERTFGRAR